MHTFLVVLQNTPGWAWLILAYLVYSGVKRTRPHVKSPVQIILPSAIFLALIFAKLAQEHFAEPALAGIAAGAILAVIFVSSIRPARDTYRQADGRLVLAGEYHSLALMMTLFCVNYANAVGSAMAPLATGSAVAVFGYSLVNGFCTFYMASRSLAHMRATSGAAV
ncbi:DUF6622 family protein [Agrobacterium sp. ES01]|uniref:DUF6622 family protein n=1 Tax=Agrobacterium sp. ES01 TaxID=3420714 RepID=UPI003D0A75B8